MMLLLGQGDVTLPPPRPPLLLPLTFYSNAEQAFNFISHMIIFRLHFTYLFSIAFAHPADTECLPESCVRPIIATYICVGLGSWSQSCFGRTSRATRGRMRRCFTVSHEHSCLRPIRKKLLRMHQKRRVWKSDRRSADH